MLFIPVTHAIDPRLWSLILGLFLLLGILGYGFLSKWEINPHIGYRTGRSKRSQRNWRIANRFAGGFTSIGAALQLLLLWVAELWMGGFRIGPCS